MKNYFKFKNYCLGKCYVNGIHNDAEDLVQDFFLKEIEGKNRLFSHMIKDHHRKYDKYVFIYDLHESELVYKDNDLGLDSILSDAKNVLDDRAYSILHLRYKKQLLVKQISQIHNLSPERVNQILKKAIKTIRHSISI